MKLFPRLIPCLLCLFSISVWGQTQEEQIAVIVNEYLTPNSPGMAILVTKGEEVLYEEAFGRSDLSSKQELQTNQPFRIGSITKQFTAVAILKLAQENKLDLEDTLEQYFLDAGSKKSISIRQLLNHTSGLGSQSDIPSLEAKLSTGDYPQNILKDLWDTSLRFEPGTQFYYSNLGYILLGAIIEKASGLSYEEYLAKNFFQVLGMENTGFEYLEAPISLMGTGYSKIAGKYENAASLNMEIPYAAGGLISTLADLSLWNHSVMQGKVINQYHLNQIMASGTLTNGKSIGYSMGWHLGEIQGFKTVKHDGIINGFTSMAIYIPEQEVFVAVLSNCDCYRDIELPTSKIAAVIIDKPFLTDAIHLDKDVMKNYQGTYQKEGDEIRIVLHDDQLMHYPKNGIKSKMIPVAKDQFLLPNGVDQIAFKMNADKVSYSLSTLAGTQRWERVSSLDGYSSIALSMEDLDEFVGKYQVQDRFVFEVFREGDKMYGKIGNDSKEILCYDKDKFCVLSMDALVDFHRGDKGQITKLTVKQGAEFTGLKIDE